jgi:hypothetical protein
MLTETPWFSNMAAQPGPKRAAPKPRGHCIEECHKKSSAKEDFAGASSGSERSSSSKQNLQEQKNRSAAASQSGTSAGTKSKPIAQFFLAHRWFFS